MKLGGWISLVQESLSNFLDVKVKDNQNTLLSISFELRRARSANPMAY